LLRATQFLFGDSGVTIGRARRAVHAGPALWAQNLPDAVFLSFFGEEGALLEYLHAGPLQPCYATDVPIVEFCKRVHKICKHLLKIYTNMAAILLANNKKRIFFSYVNSTMVSNGQQKPPVTSHWQL